jgi:hypothetical protein
MAQAKSTKRSWHFFRSGGLDQVKLESGADLMMLDQLDQKLWVALACPAKGLNIDAKTLSYIDVDADGRIRVPEIIAAIKWSCNLLKNPDDLLAGAGELSLAALNNDVPEAKTIHDAAAQTLASLDKSAATAITVEDGCGALERFFAAPFNGDGIITAEAITEPATLSVFNDIIASLEPATDRSGKPGINREKTELFFAEARAFVTWYESAAHDTRIFPLGDSTAAASAAIAAVHDKIDDYFTRCRLAAFDPRAINVLNREEKDYCGLTTRELNLNDADIAALPLSRIEPQKALPLASAVNPAWAERLAQLHTAAVIPMLGGKNVLTEADWQTLQSRIAPYQKWLADKTGAAVERLGIERIQEILSGKAQLQLIGLIEKDLAEAGRADAISALDKLTHFNRDLYRLCCNFVNFKDFYSSGEKAIFQSGTLYLDQRHCDLCLQVQDSGKHAGIAAMAGAYLVYCDCTRKGAAEKIQIVAVLTDGDSDNLIIGRNGLFYDHLGRDWDAVVTKIVENPISLRQAFWAPYKGFVRMVETQIAKRAAAADSASQTKLGSVAATAATVDKTKPAEAKKIDVGTVAALGVAVGAIGTFFATALGYLSGILKLGPLAIIGTVIGLFILISVPSLILAYIKLRKRNLGPILDANGWAINARAKITVPLGAKLTRVAKLPAGSQRDLFDPFAEKKSAWPKIILAGVIVYLAYVICNRLGLIALWSGKLFGGQ